MFKPPTKYDELIVLRDVDDSDGGWAVMGAVEHGGSLVHAGCVE